MQAKREFKDDAERKAALTELLGRDKGDKAKTMDVWLSGLNVVIKTLKHPDAPLVLDEYDQGDVEAIVFDPVKPKWKSAREFVDAFLNMSMYGTPTNKPLYKDAVPPVKKSFISSDAVMPSHASAIFKMLEGDKGPQEMAISLFNDRGAWSWPDFIISLTKVVQACQGVTTGEVGSVTDITSDQLALWMSKISGAQINVGPYLVVKLAHQIGATMRITGSTQTLTRGKHTINVGSAFDISGDVASFVDGMMLSGKRVGYVHIPVESYTMVELMQRFRKVSKVGGAVIVQAYLPKEPKEYDLTSTEPLSSDESVHREMMALIDEGAVRINKAKIVAKDVDLCIDMMAQEFSPLLTDSVKKACAGFRRSLKRLIERFENTLTMAFEAEDPKLGAEVLVRIASHTAPKLACDYIEKCRKGRNSGLTSQYTLKNACSVGGNASVPCVDTILKGARIRSFIDGVRANTEDKVLRHKNSCMYGVHFGHMVQPLQNGPPGEDGRPKVENWALFDVQPQRKSSYAIQQGDIFTAVHEDALIVDDTNTNTKLGARAAPLGVEKSMLGDQYKVLHFTEKCRSCTIISKISLESLVAPDIENALFPPSGDRPFSYVRLVKFGKLHNPEVFLILSNKLILVRDQKTDPLKYFKFDKKACCISTSFANTVIQPLWTSGIGVSSMNRLHMDEVWLQFVRCLPRSWPWYDTVHKTEVVVNLSIEDLENEDMSGFGAARGFSDDDYEENVPEIVVPDKVKGTIAQQGAVEKKAVTKAYKGITFVFHKGDKAWIPVTQVGIEDDLHCFAVSGEIVSPFDHGNADAYISKKVVHVPGKNKVAPSIPDPERGRTSTGFGRRGKK